MSDRTNYHPAEYTRWNDTDDTPRIFRSADAVRRILTHIDPEGPHEGTDDTPERVAKMWVRELCSGYAKDPAEVLKKIGRAHV